MPKVTLEHFAQRKQQILQDCIVCFSRKGFHQTSMRDLCEALNISAGGLYRYFGSKEEIIHAMVEEDHTQWLSAFSTLSPDLSFRDSLVALAAMAEKIYTTSREINSVWLQIHAESASNPSVQKLIEQHYRSFSKMLEQVIKRAQARRELTSHFSAAVLANFIISAFDGLMMRMVVDSTVSSKKLSRDFVNIITQLTDNREDAA